VSFFGDLKADIGRYTAPAAGASLPRTVLRFCGMAYKHPGILAVFVYRLGKAIRSMRIPVVKQLSTAAYYGFIYPVPRFVLGVEIPLSCEIGGGLAVWHYGGIIFGGGVIAGKNLSVNSGVMIGRRAHNGPIARLGDDVAIHAHSIVLCETVGNGATIGAGSVVLKNVRDGALVVGNPAVEKSRKSS
jgi:serine O-acetyltransferase